MLLNLVHLLCDDVLGCGCGSLSGILGRLSGNFGGIFLLSFVLFGLLSSFLLEMLELADLLFDLVHLLVGFVLGMGSSLSSLLLNFGGLGRAGLSVALFALLGSAAMAALFVVLFQDRLLGLVLCLLDGMSLRVLSVDQLIMLNLNSLLSLCLCDLDLLLLLLKLLDALFHFYIMLLLDLFIVGLLFLANFGLLLRDFLDMLVVLTSLILFSRFLGLLGNSLSGLVGAAAATELLAHVLNDLVVVTGESLGIDTMKVLVGDLILELGLDLGADTLHDLA